MTGAVLTGAIGVKRASGGSVASTPIGRSGVRIGGSGIGIAIIECWAAEAFQVAVGQVGWTIIIFVATRDTASTRAEVGTFTAEGIRRAVGGFTVSRAVAAGGAFVESSLITWTIEVNRSIGCIAAVSIAHPRTTNTIGIAGRQFGWAVVSNFAPGRTSAGVCQLGAYAEYRVRWAVRKGTVGIEFTACGSGGSAIDRVQIGASVRYEAIDVHWIQVCGTVHIGGRIVGRRGCSTSTGTGGVIAAQLVWAI